MKSVVIAIPNPYQARRLARLITEQPDFRVTACAHDLMNTYNEVEASLPRAVLIADTLAEMPEFEVMRALFSSLDVRWMVVTAGRDPTRAVGIPARSPRPPGSADLFTIASDAPEETLLRQLRALTFRPHSRPPSQRVPAADLQIGEQVTLRHHRPEANQTVLTHRPGGTGPAYSGAIILIGASTGGVDALLNILGHFPVNCAPTLVVQHTGSGFGASLAALLDRQCPPRVELATDGKPLRPGVVTVGAGTRRHLVMLDGQGRECGLQGTEAIAGHVPSVDRLFQSCVPVARRVVAALLTGMGRDGADGLKALRDAGARTFSQDEESCVVYGMPRAAAELGAAMEVLPLDRIGPALLQAASTPVRGTMEIPR